MRNFRLFLFSYTTRTSSMKYMAEAPTSAPVNSVDKITQAKKLLETIKGTPFDSEEFTKLDILLEQINKENDAKKHELF